MGVRGMGGGGLVLGVGVCEGCVGFPMTSDSHTWQCSISFVLSFIGCDSHRNPG